MFRSATALAAVLVLSAAAQAQEENIPIPYEQHAISDPTVTPYWTDTIPLLAPDAVAIPYIYAAEMPTSTGGSFVVTMFSAPFVCGINTCPVRIFEDGQMIAELNACSAPEGHALSPDGEVFFGCGTGQDLEDVAVEAP